MNHKFNPPNDRDIVICSMCGKSYSDQEIYLSRFDKEWREKVDGPCEAKVA